MSILLFFVLVIIVVCTAAVAYLNSKGIDIKSVSIRDIIANGFFVGDKDVYEVTGTLLRYEDSLNSEFGAYKGYIVRCTKNGLEYLNRNGEEEWIYTVSLNLPYFKSAASIFWLQGSNQKTFMYLPARRKSGKKSWITV